MPPCRNTCCKASAIPYKALIRIPRTAQELGRFFVVKSHLFQSNSRRPQHRIHRDSEGGARHIGTRVPRCLFGIGWRSSAETQSSKHSRNLASAKEPHKMR